MCLKQKIRKIGKLSEDILNEIDTAVFQLITLSSLEMKNIPVIILTNLDERTQGNTERDKELGAIDYWVKAHYQPGEVVEKVKILLR